MEHLEGLHRADAAIVGGELPGLLLASSLAHEGMRVAVVEVAGEEIPPFPQPASLLCGPDLARAAEVHGLSAAQEYAASLQFQLQTLSSLPRPYVQPRQFYAYARSPKDLPALESRRRLMASLHQPVSTAPDAGGCPFPVELSLMCPGVLVDISRWKDALEACILQHGGRIFRTSRVVSVDNTRVCTQRGYVDAPHIVLMQDKPPGLRLTKLLALLESRSFLQYKLTGDVPVHSIHQDIRPDGLTLIPADGGMIASWDAGRIGTLPPQGRLAALEKLLRSRLPDCQLGALRCGQRVQTLDGLPVIGPLPESPQVLCGASLQEIPAAMHAAALLTRRILGRALPEDARYEPDRHIPPRVLHPEIRRLWGLYGRNLIRRSAPSCAHCSCRMRYCSATAHWECPFCGSVYTMLGRVAAGPGMRSAQISVRQRPDI